MQTQIPGIFVIAAITTLFSAGCSKPISFSADINPILKSNCLECHDGTGEGSKKSGFNVKTYDGVMKGTKFGPVIEPGSSISSSLYLLIAHKTDQKIQMPPHHDDSMAEGRMHALSPEQIETFELWIDQGALNN